MKEALLVIDVQNIYCYKDTGYTVENCKSVINNINKLINKFEKENKIIIYVRHMHKKDGTDAGRMFDFSSEIGDIEFLENSELVNYIKELKIVGNIEVIKHRYDAFIGTNLDKILQQNKIDKLVITGFMTNFCCEATARSAHDRDYFVDFVVDATGTPGTENMFVAQTIKATCETLSSGYAKIIKTRDII